MNLDRQRPYAEIHGSADGARYEQDGRYFDAQGRAIVAESPAEAPVAKKSHKKKDD